MRASDYVEKNHGGEKCKRKVDMKGKNSRYLNITTISRRLVNQFWIEEYRVRFRKFRKVILTAAIAILLSMVVHVLISGFSSWIFVGSIAVLLLVWIFAYGYHPFAIREREFIRNVYGKHPDLTYYFYENDMAVTTKKSETVINYSQIEKVVVTKELYVLVIGNMNIYVARNGFMSGNRKRFMKLLESRINKES